MKFGRTMIAAVFAALTGVGAADAQERYLGEIFMGGWNFCPRGSAEAAGQILPIAQNSALFSLYGTTYGGDGRTTFALPDLRGRSPLAHGQGPGLSDIRLGQRGGSETNTLTTGQLPSHSHSLNAAGNGSTASPTGNLLADAGRDRIYASGNPTNALSGAAISSTGGGQAIDNRSPYLAIQYCVSTVGIFPSRN